MHAHVNLNPPIPSASINTESVQATRNSENPANSSCATTRSQRSSKNFRYAPLPPATYPLVIPRPLCPGQQLNFALYSIFYFDQRQWQRIWKAPPISLDKYLVHFDNPHLPQPTYFHPETEFMGIPYRLKIDLGKCHDLQPLFQGNTVGVYDLNSRRHRYVIDSCQLIRDDVAYLIVHNRYFDDQGFTSVNDPRHPSFVLEVPDFFNKLLIQPHLDIPNSMRASRSNSFFLRLPRLFSQPSSSAIVDDEQGLIDTDPARFWASPWTACFCGLRDCWR